MDWRYLDLADSALHAPAAEFGGVEFYPDLARKTAVLASRLIRNHPLPDGNKRVAYLCALEFVARNGGTWTYPPDDPEGDLSAAVAAARSSASRPIPSRPGTLRRSAVRTQSLKTGP